MTCVFVNLPYLAGQTGNIFGNPNKKKELLCLIFRMDQNIVLFQLLF